MTKPAPPPLHKRSLPSTKPEGFIVVSLEDAKWWAKFAAGASRSAMWSDVVKRMERLEAQGYEAECRWWPVTQRRHPSFPSHGALDVVRAAPALPVVSVRKRG